MRGFGKVESGFWDNPKIAKLTDSQKLLLIYLYSCKHGNSIGCFVLRREYIAIDLGWDIGMASRCHADVIDMGFLAFDEVSNTNKILGWWEHNPICVPNHAKSAYTTALQLPKGPLKDATLAELRGFAEADPKLFKDAMPMASECHADGIRITETETETKKETKTKKKGADAPHAVLLSELLKVLDADRAAAVIEHRQKLKKPLTAHAAKLLAGQLSRHPDANAAADMMIMRGWQAFDPKWASAEQSVSRGRRGATGDVDSSGGQFERL